MVIITVSKTVVGSSNLPGPANPSIVYGLLSSPVEREKRV